MKKKDLIDISYFPGCSLATTARENNQSLQMVSEHMGFRLIELSDWNCCGSSSAHSINSDLAFHLACRNLSLAPSNRPLLVACPSCILRLKSAYNHLTTDENAQQDYARRWGRPVDFKLEIIHFFEIMADIHLTNTEKKGSLNGLRFVPYYGCMLARPPALRFEKNYFGLMENLLESCDAEKVFWNHTSRCCGTFLSVAKPDVATSMVNRIMQGAVDANAECIVTACAMCHMNLEIRCSLKKKLPIFHFSELLAIAYNIPIRKEWFTRHLIDPYPILQTRRIVT
ncbi:MAG: heterodisulfide reductase-related iron-sulfur binding cluster [Desulfobacterales bacterium]